MSGSASFQMVKQSRASFLGSEPRLILSVRGALRVAVRLRRTTDRSTSLRHHLNDSEVTQREFFVDILGWEV
jgi:hypothetical protein